MSPTIKYNCGCNYWRYWIIGALGQCPHHHLKWLLIHWLFSCQQLHCKMFWAEGIKEQPSVFRGGTAVSRGYVTLWYDTAQQRVSEPAFKEASVCALPTYSSHALRQRSSVSVNLTSGLCLWIFIYLSVCICMLYLNYKIIFSFIIKSLI